MSQLTANQVNIYDSDPAEFSAVAIADNVIVYKGSAVGSLNGYGRQLVAADVFLGFAEQHIDNTATGHVVGGINIPLRTRGRIQVPIANAAVTDVNKAVYMSDGNTFTYTSSSNTLVGRVLQFISTGIVLLEFSVGAQSAS